MYIEKEFRQYLKKFTEIEFPNVKSFIWYNTEETISIHCDKIHGGYLITEYEVITNNRSYQCGMIRNKFIINCKDGFFPAKEIYSKVIL